MWRPSQVTDVATEFNNSTITAYSYNFDGLGRATNAVRNIQPLTFATTNVYSYNARSEVTGATVSTNDYSYTYDNIGNQLYTSLNAITNAYTVNNLNQYKAVTNLIDLTGFRLGHDADGNTSFIDGNSLLYDPENRLFAYIFGLNNSTTGTLRSAYVYDYLGRRVKKMEQECKEKDSGGIGHFTYWQTNAVTTFVYDGWNLVHEHLALTNGTTQEVSYFWGKDLSGSMQGAGGVGGLLAASIDGDFYFPCYDNNGNITAYIDESGSVIAYRVFDAFGNTVRKGGSMVDTFHFWFSTKYLDHDTGLYYYGYRYYSPMLQRWINRDPIEESGGANLYGFVRNRPIYSVDYLGLTKVEIDMDVKKRRYPNEAERDTLVVNITVLEPPRKGNVLNFLQIVNRNGSDWAIDAEGSISSGSVTYPYYFNNIELAERTRKNSMDQDVIEFADGPIGSLVINKFFLFVVEFNRSCKIRVEYLRCLNVSIMCLF